MIINPNKPVVAQSTINIPIGSVSDGVDTLGNWTVNAGSSHEGYQFYVDIPVKGMTAKCCATVVVKGVYNLGAFESECIEGALRIFARVCPSSESKAIVKFGVGDGTAVVIGEDIGVDNYISSHNSDPSSHDDIRRYIDEKSTCDSELSLISENSVQNKVITENLNSKSDIGHTHTADEVTYNEGLVSTKLDDLDTNVSQIVSSIEIGGRSVMINIKTEDMSNWRLTEGYFGSAYISTGG